MTITSVNKQHILATLLALMIIPSPTFSAPGLDGSQPIAPYLNGAFPTVVPSSSSATSGAPPDDWETREYFPGIQFVEPLRIIEHPNEVDILIVSKDGTGHLMTNEQGSTDKRLFFDIRAIMSTNTGLGEGGISDMVFHPEFGQADSSNSAYVYISYWHSPATSGSGSDDDRAPGYDRLSRFTVINNQVAVDSELVLYSQYDRSFWHMAMDLVFGDDGYLYISTGDESPRDFLLPLADTTQRIDGGLFSGILRIDVDRDPMRSRAPNRQPRHPGENPGINGPDWPDSSSSNYFIPLDNPFLSNDGSAMGEYYAIGLRHPWTMKKDSLTGDIWIGDVGKASREEINLLAPGANYGWPFREGDIAGPSDQPDTIIGTLIEPAYTYPNTVGKAVIAAGVYRGDLYPELYGRVLFSDFSSGRFWAADINGKTLGTPEEITDIPAGWNNAVQGFLLDSKGQILMVKSEGNLMPGSVLTLVREGAGLAAPTAPATLSQTGAFKDIASLEPADGCIQYSLNTPFWSDAAEKYRWLCLPNDGSHDTAEEKIQFSEENIWKFPAGTVLIKHFNMRTDKNDPASVLRLETRFLVKMTTGGYYGLSYRWNNAGTDAVLVDNAGDTRTFTELSTTGSIQRSWEYPSRDQCLQCHMDVAGGHLGINTRQLNRDHNYPGSRVSNQLETFAHLGMLESDSDIATVIANAPTLTTPDDLSASLTDRARSYLDSNCSSCHLENGVRALWDARITTPLSRQGIIMGDLLEESSTGGDAVLVPGRPDLSTIMLRAGIVGEGQMPPIGKNVVDVAGMDLLRAWIVELGDAIDSDGDGVIDPVDELPKDPTETFDSDGDGIGDNSDPAPNDSESIGSGVGISSSNGGGILDPMWLLALVTWNVYSVFRRKLNPQLTIAQ